MIDREHYKTFTVMIILYFIVYNDHSFLSYQETRQIFPVLQMPNMLINDKYSSYTSKFCNIGILIDNFKTYQGWSSNRGKSFPFCFLMRDEATNRTLEQRLIVMLFIYQIMGKYLMLQDLLIFWLFEMVKQNLCMRLSLNYWRKCIECLSTK